MFFTPEQPLAAGKDNMLKKHRKDLRSQLGKLHVSIARVGHICSIAPGKLDFSELESIR